MIAVINATLDERFLTLLPPNLVQIKRFYQIYSKVVSSVGSFISFKKD